MIKTKINDFFFREEPMVTEEVSFSGFSN
jgi:hypothetical protein